MKKLLKLRNVCMKDGDDNSSEDGTDIFSIEEETSLMLDD